MKPRWLCVLASVVLVAVFSVAQQSGNQEAGSTPSSPEAHVALPQRVRVSQGVAQGLLIKKVQPKYPEDARQARIQGSVVLQALIDKEGNVEDLTLVSGHPKLAPAAIEAVKQWKYRPYLLNGQPVYVETQVTVNFSLARN